MPYTISNIICYPIKEENFASTMESKFSIQLKAGKF